MRDDDNPYRDGLEDRDDIDPSHLRSKPQSSGTSKILWIIVGIGGFCALLCCGGVVYFFSKFKPPEPTNDPAEVAAISQSILDIQIPARFKPQMAMQMDMIVAKMDMAIYQTDDEQNQLMFMKMNIAMAEQDLNQMKQQMQVQNSNKTQLEEAKSETKTYEIDGQKISVTFAHGKLAKGQGVEPDQVGKEWFSVNGYVPRKDGLVLFSEAGPEEAFDEAEIEAMIESIKLK